MVDATFALAGDYGSFRSRLNTTDLENDGDMDLTFIGNNTNHVTLRVNRCLP